MALPALAIGALGLMAGSSILGGIAGGKANKAAEAAARLNALATRISTAFKVQDIRDAGERLESSQRAAYGKSGVDMSSGSPAEVIMASARNIEKEAWRAKYAGDLQEQGAMSAADAFREAGSYSLLGGFLKGGAAVLGGYGSLMKSSVLPNKEEMGLIPGEQAGTWP